MKYEQPLLEIIKMEVMDVITTSPLGGQTTGQGNVKDFGDTGW